MRGLALLLLAISLCSCSSSRTPIDLRSAELVDLTWAFDERTIYWPSSPSAFEKKELAFGQTAGGYFYSSFAFCTPEHGGTHLDAPIHFAAGGATSDHVALRQLIAPAVVIDVSSQASADRDYRLSVADVEAWERVHGRIGNGTIVLLHTGWSRHWPDRKAYLGDDTPNVTINLHFPSYGADAARVLVSERRVAALGVDAASIDYGQSRDFMVHRIAAAASIPGFENVTNLGALPARGAWVFALPMKIAGGSGGPLRIVAAIPR